jgi:hypothetical protein
LVECAFPGKAHVPSGPEDVITIGQALIRQQAALPHGSFLAEFAMTPRTGEIIGAWPP